MTDLLPHTPEMTETGEVPIVAWSVIARAHHARRRMEASPVYRWWVMAIVLGGLFSIGISITVLSVAIPRLAHDFHSNKTTLSWVITGPLLGYAVLQPTVGKLGDLFGHKRLYVIGFMAEAVAAALVAVAWSAPSLIAFRVIGGSVGAAASPTSMALIMEVFPPRERVRAMGWWSFVGAGAPVLGVVAGGPIIEHFSWRWIFAVQAPLCLLTVVLGGLLLPSRRHTVGPRPRFDLAGSITISVAVAAGLLALNRGSVAGWTSPFVTACLVVFPLGLAAFALIERRASSPLLPIQFLHRRNFTAPLVVMFFGNFVYLGSFLITPLFLQDVLGYTPSRAGLVVIARPLTFAIAAPTFGYVAVRLGERVNAIAGMTAIVASMLVFSMVHVGTSVMVIYFALALAGLGLGMAMPSLNASVANSVDEANLGVASAAVGMMSTIGGVVGMQVMLAVQSMRVQAGVSAARAYDDAYLFGGGLALVVLAAAFFVARLPRDGQYAPSSPLHPA